MGHSALPPGSQPEQRYLPSQSIGVATYASRSTERTAEATKALLRLSSVSTRAFVTHAVKLIKLSTDKIDVNCVTVHAV
eukprot:3900912-Amphidinium_carterae.1